MKFILYIKVIRYMYVKTGLLLGLALLFTQPKLLMGQQIDHTLETQVETDYWLYLPEEYKQDNNKAWPLLIFLHGAGERGDDIEKVKAHGPPKLAENKDFPFIIVSPQCPSGEWWNVYILNKLFDEISTSYRVDLDRVYLTGLSMGGFGTWNWAIEHPEKFAAIAPICGGGTPEKAWRIRNIPAWIFHGAKDQVVPAKLSYEMERALEKVGSHPILTIYPEANHDSWTETYNNPELYEWLLSHTKPEQPTYSLKKKKAEQYIGKYVDTQGDTILVSYKDDYLILFYGQMERTLTPEREDIFSMGRWYEGMTMFDNETLNVYMQFMDIQARKVLGN